MELLRDYKSLDDSTVVVSIKYLVHLVGDRAAIGTYRDVKITDSNTWALFGQLI